MWGETENILIQIINNFMYKWDRTNDPNLQGQIIINKTMAKPVGVVKNQEKPIIKRRSVLGWKINYICLANTSNAAVLCWEWTRNKNEMKS